MKKQSIIYFKTANKEVVSRIKKKLPPPWRGMVFFDGGRLAVKNQVNPRRGGLKLFKIQNINKKEKRFLATTMTYSLVQPQNKMITI